MPFLPRANRRGTAITPVLEASSLDGASKLIEVQVHVVEKTLIYQLKSGFCGDTLRGCVVRSHVTIEERNITLLPGEFNAGARRLGGQTSAVYGREHRPDDLDAVRFGRHHRSSAAEEGARHLVRDRKATVAARRP